MTFTRLFYSVTSCGIFPILPLVSDKISQLFVSSGHLFDSPVTTAIFHFSYVDIDDIKIQIYLIVSAVRGQ